MQCKKNGVNSCYRGVKVIGVKFNPENGIKISRVVMLKFSGVER